MAGGYEDTHNASGRSDIIDLLLLNLAMDRFWKFNLGRNALRDSTEQMQEVYQCSTGQLIDTIDYVR